MSSDNLLLALRKYAPTPDRDSREDFITEAFAWLLRAHPSLAGRFLAHLGATKTHPLSNASPTDVRWRTQLVEQDARFDMVAERGTTALVFEHKIWAEVGASTLSRYHRIADKRWPGGHHIVLVTASASQHDPGAEVVLTWAEVHTFIEEWLRNQASPPNHVADFLELLRVEGLGPRPLISDESMKGYFEASSLVPRFLELVRSAKQRDWGWFYESIAWRKQSRTPWVEAMRGGRPRWGRMGLGMLAGWRPGIFFGAMFDGSDHFVAPSSPELGPDFCLVLTFHLDESGVPSRDAYVGSAEFKALRTRLQSHSTGKNWSFVDRTDSTQNRWHPIHLRRPLLRVLEGASTFDQQVDAFVETSRQATEWLLEGGELSALRDRFQPDVEAQPPPATPVEDASVNESENAP